MTTHQQYMNICLNLAKKAFEKDEIPIGAIVVDPNGKIIAKAFNKRNSSKNAIHHAEILAIEKACKVVGDWRLENCVLYVTVLPCPMCAGAIVNARIQKVFYGTDNQNKQLFEQIMSQSALNHATQFEGGILATECAQILQQFFEQKRDKESKLFDTQNNNK